MIKVLSGKDKSRVQYKRNACLGNIGMAKVQIRAISAHKCLDREEHVILEDIMSKFEELDNLMRVNAGSKIEIVKIKDE